MDDSAIGLRDRFLSAMRCAAATVNIVTTNGPAGRGGVTVSAMSSVSADSPTLLVCIHEESRVASSILGNHVFCVNVLRDDQVEIAERFAGRAVSHGADKFACAHWTEERTGAPRLIDPLVAFDCRLAGSQKLGTHHVLIGSIVGVFMAGSGSPLVYSDRSYARVCSLKHPIG
jgi:flavin reductase